MSIDLSKNKNKTKTQSPLRLVHANSTGYLRFFTWMRVYMVCVVLFNSIYVVYNFGKNTARWNQLENENKNGNNKKNIPQLND